jgi:hypothetical protein
MAPTQNEQAPPTDDRLAFVPGEGGYVAEGDEGRTWHIRPVVTGWRLEFADQGDEQPTYAGTHGTLERAKHAATG